MGSREDILGTIVDMRRPHVSHRRAILGVDIRVMTPYCPEAPLTPGSITLSVTPSQAQISCIRCRARAIPASSEARSKVVSAPRQFSKVQAGDIMVTRSTDPGWTPIFGLPGGLIMESGGQLSHGAVVAREYGLPAVAGIAGVTQLLHDGQVVLLDGLSGTVTVIISGS